MILATEGYTANLPGHHRALLPLNSAMIVTEPLPAELWRELRWNEAETLLDGSHLYTYSQRTAQGRIAIGGRGVPYRFASRTDREGPVPERTVRELQERLRTMFPAAGDVAVARAWHGVLGVSRDWCPTVDLDPATGVGFAGAYAGEGVAASNLAGRTMRDLILGRDSELDAAPLGRQTRSQMGTRAAAVPRRAGDLPPLPGGRQARGGHRARVVDRDRRKRAGGTLNLSGRSERVELAALGQLLQGPAFKTPDLLG